MYDLIKLIGSLILKISCSCLKAGGNVIHKLLTHKIAARERSKQRRCYRISF